MKILLAWMAKFVGDYGGTEKVCCHFAKEMTLRGHDVTIVYCTEKAGTPCEALPATISLRNLAENLPGKKWESARSLAYIIKRETLRIFKKEEMHQFLANFDLRRASFAMTNLLAEVMPDVIVAFDARTAALLSACKQETTPLVTMCHFNANHILEGVSKAEREALQTSAMVQVLMPQDIEIMEKELPGVHLVRIPNVVPQYDVPDRNKEPLIIDVARLDGRQKRQHILIEAFSQIASRHPEWTLELWGTEQGRHRYTRRLLYLIRKYGLQDRVFLKGNTDDVEAVYRRASIFAFPSAYEGFPLAMTEAMSAGIPVVGFRTCPAVKEILRHEETGLLVEERTEAFAAGMERLMQDEDFRRKLGKAAKEDMQAYTAQSVWDTWENLLQSLQERASEGKSN